MRPRHVLLLTGLAALPILLAFTLVGGGALSGARGGGARGALAQVSLKLVGSRGHVPGGACGISHGYEVYPAGATVEYRGTTSPSGRFAVTLKLKACYGGAFQSAGDAQANVRPDGAYGGSFPAPIPGYYYARAELKQNGAQVGRSAKRYFEIR